MNLRASSTFKAGSFAALESLLVPKLVNGAAAAAQAVLEISQGLVPVRTGELKASGGTSVEWTGKTVTGYVVYTSPHAAYNEFGTGRRGEESGHGAPGISYDPNWPGMTGSPYIRPAMDIGRSQVITAFQTALGV
jgi:hypothetical protein